MECSKVSDLLSEYLEGLLHPEERIEIENHLGKCSKCQREARNLKTTLDALHSLGEIQASPDFFSRVMEKIEALQAERKVITLAWLIGLLRIHRRAILAGLASFAITFGISLGFLNKFASDRHASTVNQVQRVEAYVIKEVVQPIVVPQDTTSVRDDTSLWDEFDVRAEKYIFPVSAENQPF